MQNCNPVVRTAVDESLGPALIHHVRVGALLFALFLAAGCATRPEPDFLAAVRKVPAPRTLKTKPKPVPAAKLPARPVVTSHDAPLGVVMSVNPGLRFAVVDFGLGRVPSDGERFGVYRDKQKVGELKINGPREETNTVGDITAGEARPGDEVRPE